MKREEDDNKRKLIEEAEAERKLQESSVLFPDVSQPA
jgi:hypothetical protein